VREWLGTRRLIPIILLVILADLLIANQVMHMDLWVKVIVSVVVVSLLWYFYRRQHLYELV
jgi:hypothetical protein